MTATSELIDGVTVTSLNPGCVLDVETKNRRYHIEYVKGDEVRISGHPSICPTPTAARLVGSSSGIGGLQAGVLKPGMHLVFERMDENRPITTSEITGIRVKEPR
jgi:hypothetical protein